MDKFERDFHNNRRRAYKKISKKVIYDNQEFESGRALSRFLKLEGHSSIYRIIKQGEYKGKKVFYKK